MKLNALLWLPSLIFLVIGTQIVSIDAAPRIIGGSYASEGQFPYAVALLYNESHYCGGSIISENYIVTAAYCLYEVDAKNQTHRIPIKSFSIRAGSISYKSGGKILQINEAFKHPLYTGFPDFENDIALLKLSEPLTFSDTIKPIRLARKQPKRGAPITISGWGKTNSKGERSEKLRYNKYLTADAQCGEGVIFMNHREGNGICEGDYGGPAVYNDELVGIASGYEAECGSNAPDHYTLVPFFYEWLHKNSDFRN